MCARFWHFGTVIVALIGLYLRWRTWLRFCDSVPRRSPHVHVRAPAVQCRNLKMLAAGSCRGLNKSENAKLSESAAVGKLEIAKLRAATRNPDCAGSAPAAVARSTFNTFTTANCFFCHHCLTPPIPIRLTGSPVCHPLSDPLLVGLLYSYIRRTRRK